MTDAELSVLSRQGSEEATWALALRAEPRIATIVSRYLRSKPCKLIGVLQEEDLKQDAIVACFNAAKLWTPGTVLFSKYASKCIRNEIQQSFANFMTAFKIGCRRFDYICEAKRKFDEFQAVNGREPITDKEWSAIGNTAKASTAKCYVNITRSLVYLDDPRNSELPDNSATDESPRELLDKKEMRNLMHAYLDALEPKLKTVVSLAFGFDNKDPLSLSQIGRVLGCPRMTACRLLNYAIAKLRAAIRERL